MAKYKVEMSCGHVEEIQLFGKMEDRRRKIAWLEEHGVCTECRKAHKEAEHVKATAKAAEKATVENLPALTGTEKQINWALVIRAEKLAEIDALLSTTIKIFDGDNDKIAESNLNAQAIKNVMARQTEAKFWIDRRDLDAQSIIKGDKMAEQIKSELGNAKTETNSAAEAEAAEEENETIAEIKKEFEHKVQLKTQEVARLKKISDDALKALNAHLFQAYSTSLDVESYNKMSRELNKKFEDAFKASQDYKPEVLIRVDVASVEKAIEVIKQIAPGEYKPVGKCYYKSENNYSYEESSVATEVDYKTYKANAHRKDFYSIGDGLFNDYYYHRFKVIELWNNDSDWNEEPNGDLWYKVGAGLVTIFVVDADKFSLIEDDIMLNNQSIERYHILEFDETPEIPEIPETPAIFKIPAPVETPETPETPTTAENTEKVVAEVAINDGINGKSEENEVKDGCTAAVNDNIADVDDTSKNKKICGDISYNLGKVFATCQHIINIGQNDIDYYVSKCGGNAVICALPRTEFAMIQKKTQPALKKIKAKNPKLFEKLDKELCEAISLIDELPTKLPVDGTTQSNFIIGYWHQVRRLDTGDFGKVAVFSTTKGNRVQSAALDAVLESSREVIDDLKDDD